MGALLGQLQRLTEITRDIASSGCSKKENIHKVSVNRVWNSSDIKKDEISSNY